MEIRCYVRKLSYQSDKFVVRCRRIQRTKLQRRKFGNLFQDLSDQTAERGLPRAGVYAGKADFGKTLCQQGADLVQNLFGRNRAVGAAGLRHNTISAMMVAALLNLHKGAMTPFEFGYEKRIV